jgi:small subunit ribosomal protein S1
MQNETIDTSQAIDTSDAGVWITGPDGELIPDYESTFPTINEGEVVHGTVVRVDKDEVLVDIGYKSEGVIPVSELSIRRSINPADEVNVGDEIDALVLTKEDAEGRLILSKKRARFELAWKAIEQAAESGQPVTGRVIEVVKGGLILDLGVRGFLPASLVDIRRVQDLDEFLGKELRCKVIELNRSRNNVVLSRRAVLEDERKEMRQAILDRLAPGDVVEGQISNIVDFGAFVDLDGMDGLIHISELSWSHVNHPSEVLEIGQTVKVKVLDIDRDRQRISLGLKQTQTDPWQQVLDSYGEGDVVQGRVTKVVTFGAFVEILPGVEGLVHISELAQHHVENPREVVSQGDLVNAKIIEVDAERRRLSLSLKRIEDGDPTQPLPEGAEPMRPQIDLSEEVFADAPAAPPLAGEALEVEAVEEPPAEEPAAEAAAVEEPPVEEPPTEEPAAEAAADEVQAAEPEPEPEASEPDEAPEQA